MPASASEENIELLVRLKKDGLVFSLAKASGEGIRFATHAVVPLAYEIEEWNAVDGTASVWLSLRSRRRAGFHVPVLMER